MKIELENFKKWAVAVLVWLFLIIWGAGFTTSLMATACQKSGNEGSKKLRYCNISIMTYSWVSLIPSENARFAPVHLHKGIALYQLGRDDAAIIAFQKAFREVSGSQRERELQLHAIIAQTEDKELIKLWLVAIDQS